MFVVLSFAFRKRADTVWVFHGTSSRGLEKDVLKAITAVQFPP